MTAVQLLTGTLIILVAGAVLSAVLAKKRVLCGYVAFGATAIASIVLLQITFSIFSTGPIESIEPLLRIPGVESLLHYQVDQLSAFFLFIIAIVGLCTTLFSTRYMEEFIDHNPARYYPTMLLMFASMILVVAVRNMLFFIAAWELMTLLAYLLIIHRTEDPEATRGGLLYFIATNAGTALMIIATVLLYMHTPARSFEFADLQSAMNIIVYTRPALAHLILALYMLAFGTKAGVFPLGFWLPIAYPAAPTGASAALGGLMTKLGVYGIVRIFIGLLPYSQLSLYWGVAIAFIGCVSIVVGTLTALQQTEAKRLLSFHIIGQIGYMWLGVGIGIAFITINPEVAVLGLMGGLFHVLNNACYKTLLFLNVGAAQYRTGSTQLDAASGLMRIMPITATCAIIAALSISGVPPLSGFTSKWLIFERSIAGGLYVPVFILFGLVAIFISAVTLASFLKFIGSVFIGQLDVEDHVIQRDVPLSMSIPQMILAFFCVLFGVAPMLVLRYLYAASVAVMPDEYAPAFNALVGHSHYDITLKLGTEGVSGTWGPLPVVAAFTGCLLLAWLISRLGGSRIRRVPVWLCGEKHSFDEIMYSSHSFMFQFNRFFNNLYPSLRVPSIKKPRALAKILDTDSWLTYPVRKIAEGCTGAHGCTAMRALRTALIWVIALGVAISLFLVLRG